MAGSLITKAAMGLALGGAAGAGSVPTYGAVERQVRSTRGLGEEVFPLDAPTTWVVPVIASAVVGLAVTFTPKWVGVVVAATGWGLAMEALRRRTV